MHKILAVDDDEQFLEIIVELLKYRNYKIDTVINPVLVPEKLRENEYDCILLDVKMPGIDGLTLLEKIIEHNPPLPVIMISGQSTLSIAVNAIKKGAYDFLEKGGDSDRLLITIQNAIDKSIWQKEREFLLSEIHEQFQMVGNSKTMQNIFHQIKTIAPTDAKVLIYGETGTGKELVARAIHLNSERAARPYVKVNCAAIPETLVESTFFGHKKGSFSGAYSDQTGKFELANEGTIFLDEIGELNINAQAKLLRVLQDGEIETVGDSEPRRVNVRVIAATNKNLHDSIKNGRFREDLYHRLKVFELTIPPLRKRKGDIPLLVQYYLDKFSSKYNKKLLEVSAQGMELLMQQTWSGNVRMLENTIEKATILAKKPIIHVDEIMFALRADEIIEQKSKNHFYLKEYIESKEKEFIEHKLIITKGKKQQAADLLGIDRATLWKKINKYNIEY